MAASEERRRRIVEAATKLFHLYGFKRTSVDLLAAEAGVAKPTVYAYFADKDAVFCAVVEAVCDELVLGARQALAQKGAIEERLAAALSAKFTRYFELVEASPHAAELVDSHNRLGAEIVQRADRAYLALVVAAIEEARARAELEPERLGLSATTLAQLLLRAASGAAYDAKTVAGHRRNVAELVRVIVAAMR